MAAILALAARSDLRPLKPDVVPEIPWAALVALAIVLAASAVVAWRRRRPTEVPPAPAEDRPEPPATLRERLERVRRSGWLEAGDQLKACEVIADVLRDLARARFGVFSLRLTTAELLAEIVARGGEEAVWRPMSDVLEACDLVKFAGVTLAGNELQGHLETAAILVDAYGTAGEAGVPPAPGAGKTPAAPDGLADAGPSPRKSPTRPLESSEPDRSWLA